MKKVTLLNIIGEHGNDFHLSTRSSQSFIGDCDNQTVYISWGNAKLNEKIHKEFRVGGYVVTWKNMKPIALRKFRNTSVSLPATERANAYVDKLNRWAGK